MSSRIVLRQRSVRLLMQAFDELPEHPECKEKQILYGDKRYSIVEVKLTHKMIVQGAAAAEMKHESAMKKGLTERFKSTPRKRETGELGQIAVTYYFYRQEWFKRWFESLTFGKPDVCDIKLCGHKIDVKTFNWINKTRDPDAWMFVPLKQFSDPKRHYPYYIACQRIADSRIRILGFISREHLEDHERCPIFLDYQDTPVGVPELNQLTPIKDIELVLCS